MNEKQLRVNYTSRVVSLIVSIKLIVRPIQRDHSLTWSFDQIFSGSPESRFGGMSLSENTFSPSTLKCLDLRRLS